MSDNVPFEIQVEIVNRVVDLKSLIHFRSVSKRWKSLIESSEFITDHTLNHRTDTHHLLVSYCDTYSDETDYKFVSIVDDDSFPQQKYSHVVPPIVKNFSHAHMLDSSHGLVCLYGWGLYDGNVKNMIVLWNPLIGKSVGISFAHKPTAIGFGVCPKTIDPKIVKITQSFEIQPVNWTVEVFTLSSGAWRSISMNMSLSRSTTFSNHISQVVVDGVIYWVISDSANDLISNRIISFDLTGEEFEEVALPDELRNGNLQISKLKESLVVLNTDEWENESDVWIMMKNGFAKLFTTRAQDGFELYGMIGFRQNGQPIREHRCELDGFSVTKLEAYDPSTKRGRDLGIHLPNDSDPYDQWSIMITSYTQSLLLLGHSNSIVQG